MGLEVTGDYTSTVGAMLNVWRERLRVFDEGSFDPGPRIIEATRIVVRRLCELDPAEEIQISWTGRQGVTRRVKTDEVLVKYGPGGIEPG